MILTVLDDAPCASDRPYNALRLFRLGDGAWCGAPPAKRDNFANDIEWMMRRFPTAGNCPRRDAARFHAGPADGRAACPEQTRHAALPGHEYVNGRRREPSTGVQ